MPYNITIDDISPLITYRGQWLDSYNLTGDPYTDRYLNRTFHSSKTDGSQASFSFNGTAIYIFGAKRGNHGHYIVTLDNGDAQVFDGYAPTQSDGTDGVYQVPLYAKTGLNNGYHTVVVTNNGGSDSGRPYVDIDFITWTSGDETPTRNITIDDVHWNYTTPGTNWGTSSVYLKDYGNNTEHLTNVAGATASVTFEGNAVYFYGGTLGDHGTFNVQVDDYTPVGLNGSTNGYHAQVLLYYADGLGSGTHKLTVTNTQAGYYLDVDYVIVSQTDSNQASATNPGGKAKTPIIAGTICGVVIGLAWIIAAVWYFMRHRKRRSGTVDLINAESKPYDIPPVGYGPSNAGPGWDSQQPMQQNHQPWSNDPAAAAAYRSSQSNLAGPASTYSSSSVSGGPGSSVGAPTVTTPTTTRNVMQPLGVLLQEDERDPRVHEIVPPPNPKGRPLQVQPTGTRGAMTEDELRASRMYVPDRAQDWGPLPDTSDNEMTEMLPPDYNQATEPFPARRA